MPEPVSGFVQMGNVGRAWLKWHPVGIRPAIPESRPMRHTSNTAAIKYRDHLGRQLGQKAILAVMAAAILATTSPASAQKKSILIGLDGLGFGERGFDVTSTPRMDSLIDGTWAAGYSGAYSDQAFAGGVLGGASQQPTVSGPGWTSMATGVWANKHNVYDNSFTSPDVASFPAYLGTAKSADHRLRTATILWWQIYNDTIFDPINSDGDLANDLNYQFVSPGDGPLTANTIETLNMDGFNDFDADLTFVELGDLDAAGHNCGSSGACYAAEMIQQDLYVGQILDAITGRPNFANEDWQIIVTSDHGHLAAGGHGGHSDLERRIPFMVSSKLLNQGILPAGVSQVDVAPTVLDHFGIAVPGNYDGISRASGAPFNFLPGDVNLDGILSGDGTGPAESDDVRAFIDGWMTVLPTDDFVTRWTKGDLNFNARSELGDLVLFQDALIAGGLSFPGFGPQLPEPTTMSMVFVALAAFVARRPRSSHQMKSHCG